MKTAYSKCLYLTCLSAILCYGCIDESLIIVSDGANHAHHDPSDNNQPTDTQPTDTQPTDTQPTDTQPTDTQPTDNQPTDNQPTDNQSTDDQANDDQPGDDVPACSEGYVTCEKSVKKACVEGKYWEETLCPHGCNDQANDCALEQTPLCEHESWTCVSGVMRQCQNNTWVNDQPCPFGCNASNSACATCESGSKRCHDPQNLVHCVDGDWGNLEPCSNGCDQDACQPECTGQQVKCDGKLLKTCVNDSWQTQTCEFGCVQNACAINPMQPTRYLMTTLHSPFTPYVVEQMKQIAANNPNQNNNVFIKVGDSHYDYDFDGKFMKCFSQNNSNAVTLGDFADLQPVITAFQSHTDAFNRDSLAAIGGKSTRDVLGSNNYLGQEINQMSPRFAFFGHGTNDIGNGSFIFNTTDAGYGYDYSIQDYYRQLNKAMDQMIAAGVIPLISGIVPNMSMPAKINYIGGGPINPRDYPRFIVQSFNAVSRGVAEARQIPWFDAYRAFYSLPNFGLSNDNIHGSSNGSPCNFSSDGLKYGVNMRNIGSIQMLNAAWQYVVNNETATAPIEEPFQGSGSPTDPFLITSLPYTHQKNTTQGQATIPAYSCAPNVKEEGKEFYYKLVLTQRRALRMFAVSAAGVDVDLHVLKNTPDANACIVRTDIMAHGYLDPGTYYIVVDSYGTGAGSPGQYLLGIVECDRNINSGKGQTDYDYDEYCDNALVAI